MHTRYLLIAPTASGKTRWALDNLNANKNEIISVDSCQVYKELNIGSAKVSDVELEALPHHVINCISFKDRYDVSRYLHDSQNAYDHITSRGLTPLYLGGSMLYADKLMHGLDDVPKVPEDLTFFLDSLSADLLWERLLNLDASYANRLHKNDKQRIIRALSVLMHTGKPLYSYWMLKKPMNYSLAMIMPNCKNDLYANIEKRVDEMLCAGLIDETLECYKDKILYQSLRSVGYRQVVEYLDGEIATYADLRQKIINANCHYVKHQMTWMKKWTDLASVICTPDDLSKLSVWLD